MKTIDVQVLCFVFNGHHVDSPLPSRVVERLISGGLLSPEKPVTLPEGPSALSVYPRKMRLTKKGAREYLDWLRTRKHAFSTDMKKLEEMVSWTHRVS